MAIVAGGIVSLKPIGGIVTNNPGVNGTAMTPEQLQALQQQRQQPIIMLNPRKIMLLLNTIKKPGPNYVK